MANETLELIQAVAGNVEASALVTEYTGLGGVEFDGTTGVWAGGRWLTAEEKAGFADWLQTKFNA